MGIANLVYGFYSLYVTTQKPRPLRLVQILAVANMAWLIACLSIATFFWQEISILGLVHVVGEGIYVAALGAVEWKFQKNLAN